MGQHVAKIGQHGPKCGQDEAKMGPDGGQDEPRWGQYGLRWRVKGQIGAIEWNTAGGPEGGNPQHQNWGFCWGRMRVPDQKTPALKAYQEAVRSQNAGNLLPGVPGPRLQSTEKGGIVLQCIVLGCILLKFYVVVALYRVMWH